MTPAGQKVGSNPATPRRRLTREEAEGPSLSEQWTPRQQEDPADVVLAREGDATAFERLYRVNVGRIHGLARRMAGFDAADELTQDVFVRAWEKLASFRGDSQFSTWLYRLAVNVIIESRRAGTRRAWLQGDDEEAMRNVSVRPSDTAAAIDLDAAVQRLPQGARQVFVLHDVEGYKHHEIGTLLRISVGTSKGQLHRARMILRKHLAPGRAPLPSEPVS